MQWRENGLTLLGIGIGMNLASSLDEGWRSPVSLIAVLVGAASLLISRRKQGQGQSGPLLGEGDS